MVNSKGLTITIIVVAATAMSVLIGTRAIMGTAATLRQTTASGNSGPGELERQGSEIELLLENVADASSGEGSEAERDPMVPYTPPRRVETTPRDPQPRRPSYRVTAVVIDEADPTAVMMIDGESQIVRVGDEVKGGRVAAISHDGVSIEGDDGRMRFYSSSD